MRLRYLSEAQGRWLRAWWQRMQPQTGGFTPVSAELVGLGRGDRARLRRAASVEALEIEYAAQLLVATLTRVELRNPALFPWLERDPSPLLLVAGVLAAARQDVPDGHSLAWRVGTAAAGNGKGPPMSELRFRRALKARSPEEFFLAARRMLTLAGGVADITVLADDLLAWAFEHHGRDVSQPARSLSFRWAQDYYQPLRGKDADLAAEGTPAEGEVA